MKERDIRPKKLFEKYLYLSNLDIKKYFKKATKKINCVACGKKGKFAFKKKVFLIVNVLTVKHYSLILGTSNKRFWIITQNHLRLDFWQIDIIKRQKNLEGK